MSGRNTLYTIGLINSSLFYLKFVFFVIFSSSGHCCYNCRSVNTSQSVTDELFAYLSRKSPRHRDTSNDIQVGLVDGSLFDFSYAVHHQCPGIDPRLT